MDATISTLSYKSILHICKRRKEGKKKRRGNNIVDATTSSALQFTNQHRGTKYKFAEDCEDQSETNHIATEVFPVRCSLVGGDIGDDTVLTLFTPFTPTSSVFSF